MIPPDKSTNKVLLDPKGLLTQVLSLSAIKMVNDEVSKVYQKTASSSSFSAVESISNKREIYLTLTPAQCFERAAECGVTAALKTERENICTRVHTYTQWNCFNMRLIKISSSIRQSLFRQ